MKAILNFFWGLIASIFLILLLIVLSLTPSLLSLSNLITNRNVVINWIDQSGIYGEIVDSTIRQTNEQLKSEGLSSSEIKAIQSQIKKAISEDFIKKTVVSLVNGVYDWLEGKTENIEFDPQEIDIKSALMSFIPKEQLDSKDFMKLLNTLKPCTESQALKYEAQGGFKSIEEFCIPPKLDLIKISDDSYTENISEKAIKVDNIFQIPEIPENQATLYKDIYGLLDNLEWYLLGIVSILAILFLIFFPGNISKFYFLFGISALNAILQLILIKYTTILPNIVDSLLKTAIPTDTPIDTNTFIELTNRILTEIVNGSIYYIYLIIIVCIVLTSIVIGYTYFFGLKKVDKGQLTNANIRKNPKK